MSKYNLDKVLNSFDSDSNLKPSTRNKLNMSELNKPQQNANFQPKPQLQPEIKTIQRVSPISINDDIDDVYDTPVPTVEKVQKLDSKINDNDELSQKVEKYFGKEPIGLDDVEDEIKNSGIKIKKNVNSILAEINKRTFIQTMSKDKTQFSKTFNIKVIGIGGAGNNIVKYMKTSQEWPDFVQIIALNTDYVALSAMGDLADIFILGAAELDGNGSGGDPNVGKLAAEADAEIIKDMLKGTDVLILTAGLGKGTGTGATPIIAKIAQELGILTIGLFNLPSIGTEGNKTYTNALSGLQKLSYLCNGLTTVNNDKIISLDRERMSIKKAFEGANQYINTIVDEIINIITKPSNINIDFADVRNFFEDKNGFLFLRLDLSDYTKDAIKEALEHAIKVGFSEITIQDSQKALLNFRVNENVPSFILDNARSALKELVGVSNINIVHGISYNEVYENAQINVLLTGSFELGAIDDEEHDEESDQPLSSGTSSIDLNALSDENEETTFTTPKATTQQNPTLFNSQNMQQLKFNPEQKQVNNEFMDFYNRNAHKPMGAPSYSFDDDDDETIDNQRYNNRPSYTSSKSVSVTSNINRDYRDEKPKKKIPWWKKIFGLGKREEY